MVEIKYGLFISFVLLVWLIIEYTLIIPNFSATGSFIGAFSIVILVAGIYLGIKEHRDKSNYGYIRFREAFKIGIVITFIVGVLMVIMIYVYYEYINPDFVNVLASETEKIMMQRNTSREEINAAIEAIKYQYSLSVQIIEQLLFLLLGGIISSLIISAMLQKERRSKPIERM